MESEKEVGSVLYIVEESVATAVNPPNLKTTFPPEAVIIPIPAIPAIAEHRLQPAVPTSNNHIASVEHQVNLKKACKHCTSANIERKRRAGWEKLVLPMMKKYRYICYSCGREFYAKRAA